MKNTLHTPGPWNADKNFMGLDTYSDGNSIPVFPRGGGVAICDVVAVTGEGLSRPDVQARAEANARLIASAPELFAALRDMLTLAQEMGACVRELDGSGEYWTNDDGHVPDNRFRAARAAIAKALK